MAFRIITGLLMLLTVYFGITHGARVFQKPTPEYQQMMALLGITQTLRLLIGIVSIGSALLILLPHTFFIGNLARAMLLVLMMALALKAGNYRFALIEIPFVVMPLALIYLGHPLKTITF